MKVVGRGATGDDRYCPHRKKLDDVYVTVFEGNVWVKFDSRLNREPMVDDRAGGWCNGGRGRRC